MLVKKKSFVVAMVSGSVICLVLILTLTGYAIYVELKAEDSKRQYFHALGQIKEKIHSRQIASERLSSDTPQH